VSNDNAARIFDDLELETLTWGRTDYFTEFSRELWPMTLTFKSDLYSNQ